MTNTRDINVACDRINALGFKASIVPVDLGYPAIHIDFANGGWAEIGSNAKGMVDLNTINRALGRNIDIHL